MPGAQQMSERSPAINIGHQIDIRLTLAGHAHVDDIAGVQRFTDKLGVTFPAGLETTGSYLRFAENFRGANPFPIDVILDRDGTIAYVAREYDPAAMEAVIERLLAR